MISRKSRAAAATAVAALGFALLAAPASAATKSVVIWTDEKRGPVMTQLLGKKSPVTGYKFVIKTYASLEALDAAWSNATAATGPDLVISNSAYAYQGASDGKLMPLTLPASVKAQFSKAALNTLSYLGKVYGIPLDVDTTAMYYNKKLVKTPPKTFADMVTLYKANSSLTGGLCAMDGVWGSQPMLTALGGGAWGLKADGSPDANKVLLNAGALKSNMKKYLIGADGKSNGFFKWDGCKQDFLDGKIPFANSGGWQLEDVTKALGSNFGVMPVPGLKVGSTGSPWVGYQGIYVTTFAASHGVSAGALKFATKYMTNAETQKRLSTLGGRPPANLVAAKTIKSVALKGFAQAGGNGLTQVDTFLNNNAGGANWYDVLSDTYKKIFVDGAGVDATLDAAAAVVAKNFAAAAA